MDGCIAVHSNDFLYNAKANWNSKNHFCLKKQRGDFLGRFELFSWNFNICDGYFFMQCHCVTNNPQQIGFSRRHQKKSYYHRFYDLIGL